MGEIIYFGKANETLSKETDIPSLVVVNPVWIATTFQKIIWREDLIDITGYLDFVYQEFQAINEAYTYEISLSFEK